MHELIDIKQSTDSMVCIHSIESKYGKLCIASLGDSILLSSFEELQHCINIIQNKYPNLQIKIEESDPIQKVAKYLNEESNLTLSLIINGTEFQVAIWNEILKIPSGKTLSYKKIAEKINNPKSVRAVGAAVGANEHAILIPCHRVVYEDGHSGHFKWGADRKKKLLQMENIRGVTVNELF